MGLHEYNQLTNIMSNNSIIEIIVITILSIILILISLLITKFFRISNLLYGALFGFKIK